MQYSLFISILLFIFGHSFAQNKNRKIVTSYGYETTQVNKVKTTVSQAIQTDKFYLNSKSNALVKGGKSRTVFPVHLPENTIEWYYLSLIHI